MPKHRRFGASKNDRSSLKQLTPDPERAKSAQQQAPWLRCTVRLSSWWVILLVQWLHVTMRLQNLSQPSFTTLPTGATLTRAPLVANLSHWIGSGGGDLGFSSAQQPSCCCSKPGGESFAVLVEVCKVIFDLYSVLLSLIATAAYSRHQSRMLVNIRSADGASGRARANVLRSYCDAGRSHSEDGNTPADAAGTWLQKSVSFAVLQHFSIWVYCLWCLMWQHLSERGCVLGSLVLNYALISCVIM